MRGVGHLGDVVAHLGGDDADVLGVPRGEGVDVRGRADLTSGGHSVTLVKQKSKSVRNNKQTRESEFESVSEPNFEV